MARIQRFEDIEAWQKARQITKTVYQATSSGRFSRDFGLRDQMRRAAVSVLSNIAESSERGGDKEFLQFLAISKGSCGELRAQLYVALDQSYLAQEDFDLLAAQTLEVSRMVAGLMRYLRQSELRGSKFK
jgi:four helix bundle protein